MKWEFVSRNVALAVDLPRNTPRQITPLSEDDALRLLAALRGHRLEALYRVALALGLRRGEVLGLRWADIDFVKQTLRVSGTLQRVEGKLERSAPKTRSGARTLLLPPALVQLLEDHQRAQQEERALCDSDWQENDLVFPSERGTPIEPSNLHRQFKAVLRKAGLPATTRFHDLRHSCATFLIAQGVHPRVVMEILGHSQISLTMNTYAHVLPETQREATAKAAALFQEPADEALGTERTTDSNDDAEEPTPR